MTLQLAGSILIDGVAYAMVLFMITIGLSMTMGLMRVINLAHGAFAMAGGFAAASLPAVLGLPVWLGVLLAIGLVALSAVPIERWLLRRFYRRSELDQMLVTIGLMFIAMALANMAFGSAITSVPLPDALQGSIDIGYRLVQKHRLFVMALGVAVLLLLWFAVERSDFGIRVRAAVDNAPIAQVVGIDTARLYAIAFAAGAALAALGGIVGAELLPMEASYAGKYLVTFLAVVAVGGQGTLAGSFVAALLLGGVETAMKYLMPPLASVSFFLTMFLVLLLRPQGLFGRRA
ncbi:MAG: branched-chain amino acid ABC transporter permease [Hydrogenophaga sp.]|nr:branched-chain amino acid ABC transporter permease [Hydrogenophaga sp.]